MRLSIQLKRRRPTTVQVVEVTEDNAADVAAWCGGWVISDMESSGVRIPTDLGHDDAEAWPGDYVVRGATGTFHPATSDNIDVCYEDIL